MTLILTPDAWKTLDKPTKGVSLLMYNKGIARSRTLTAKPIHTMDALYTFNIKEKMDAARKLAAVLKERGELIGEPEISSTVTEVHMRWHEPDKAYIVDDMDIEHIYIQQVDGQKLGMVWNEPYTVIFGIETRMYHAWYIANGMKKGTLINEIIPLSQDAL